jgi:CheY-like chemotaxis protein
MGIHPPHEPKIKLDTLNPEEPYCAHKYVMNKGLPPQSNMKAERGLLAGAVVLIGVTHKSSAGITRSSMRRDGAQDVICRGTYRDVEVSLEEGGIDIALLDASLPGGDAINLARRVRFGELGSGPFMPIVITISRAGQNVIDAALNAGADDILLKPLSNLHFGETHSSNWSPAQAVCRHIRLCWPGPGRRCCYRPERGNIQPAQHTDAFKVWQRT